MQNRIPSEEEKAWNKKRANSRKSRTAGSVEEFMAIEKYQDVLKAGCGWEPSGGYDTDGDCSHGYAWDCDDCPITIERMSPNA